LSQASWPAEFASRLVTRSTNRLVGGGPPLQAEQLKLEALMVGEARIVCDFARQGREVAEKVRLLRLFRKGAASRRAV